MTNYVSNNALKKKNNQIDENLNIIQMIIQLSWHSKG